MNLEELVNDRYDFFTANDREMLAAIFRDKQAVKEMNSTQLASFLHVSRTTLVRLIKKLDIDSYKEFKLLLNRKEEEHTAYLYDLQDIVKEYHTMIDELKKHDYEKICEIIYRADTICMEQEMSRKQLQRNLRGFFWHLGNFVSIYLTWGRYVLQESGLKIMICFWLYLSLVKTRML